MKTTDCLREEHVLILKVLDCFDAALRQVRKGGRVTNAEFAPFVEFFRGFADRCHHCKEEDRLFPCLERCGVQRENGPIGVMLHEHRLGRAHVQALAAALPAADGGDQAAARVVLSEGAGFLDLLRHHIMKEDHVLFQMADEVVQGGERAVLAQGYAQAEAAAGYRQTEQRCRDLAKELTARYGVGPDPKRAPVKG